MPRRDVSPAAGTEAPRGSRPSSLNALSGLCTGTAIQSSRTKPKRQLPLIEWPCASAQPLHGVPIESPWTTRAGQGILKTTNERGSNSAGRVPASQAGCRGFESRLPLRACGRSCDRPLRVSVVGCAHFLQHRFTSSSRTDWVWIARTRPHWSWLCPHAAATQGFSWETHTLPDRSSLQRCRVGKGTISTRRSPGFRETFSLSPAVFAERPRHPPRAVDCDPMATPDDVIAAPRRAQRTKSTRAIRTRSAHHTGSSGPRSACA